MNSPITPYKISIPDSQISTLHKKLSVSSFPEEVDFSDDWAYGSTLKDVKRLAKYWGNGFDWRAQEAKINEQFPQFTTKIEVEGFGEIDMHLVHQKGKKGSVPLLFVHGWPGSFLEVGKMLKLLTEGKNGVSFHVVAPSLPNFGFSGGVKGKGFDLSKYAEAVHKVMMKLGYERYVTQGGDWGSEITRAIGLQYPKHCLASNINLIEISLDTLSSFVSKIKTPLTDQEKAGVERTHWFNKEGSGYNILQGTKPHTLSFALRDPLSLLSWIFEKLHDWTDSYPWTDDEILTWVSIYQFSRAGPESSVRIYYEATHMDQNLKAKYWQFIEGPKLGLSYFPRDINLPPSEYGRTLGEVVFERRHESGGHFAAWERPEELAGDLFEMFGEGGGAGEVGRGIVQ